MNNQVKLDKDKVIDYIEERLKYVDDAEELYQLQCKIENGYFDTTPPVPTIKPGYKVRHKIYPKWGIGEVKDVYPLLANIYWTGIQQFAQEHSLCNLEVVE